MKKPNFFIELIWSMGTLMLLGIELIVAYVVGVAALEGLWGAHSVDFEIEDQIDIHIFGDECGTCWQDWGLFYTATIEDLEQDKSARFSFWFIGMPAFDVYRSPDNPNLFIIHNLDPDMIGQWELDLATGEAQSNSDLDASAEGLIPLVHITSDFEAVAL